MIINFLSTKCLKIYHRSKYLNIFQILEKFKMQSWYLLLNLVKVKNIVTALLSLVCQIQWIRFYWFENSKLMGDKLKLIGHTVSDRTSQPTRNWISSSNLSPNLSTSSKIILTYAPNYSAIFPIFRIIKRKNKTLSPRQKIMLWCLNIHF